MKKTFCDCCGEEFDYASPDMHIFMRVNEMMLPRFCIGMADPIAIDLKFESTITNASNGERIDICPGCRWKLVDRLDPRPKAK